MYRLCEIPSPTPAWAGSAEIPPTSRVRSVHNHFRTSLRHIPGRRLASANAVLVPKFRPLFFRLGLVEKFAMQGEMQNPRHDYRFHRPRRDFMYFLSLNWTASTNSAAR